MPDYPRETCRSCSASIIWVVTTRGKDMPVDAEPDKEGNLALTNRDHLGLKPLAEVVPMAKRFGRTQLHLSHFVTCPQAGQWRGTKP